MNSQYSDGNKSSSMTSESEHRLMLQRFKEFKYPSMPKRSQELRKIDQKNSVIITTNLFELKLKYDYYKFTLFSVDILPQIDKDNFNLKRVLYLNIEKALPKWIKKAFWAGNNFFAIIDSSGDENIEYFERKSEKDNIVYIIQFKKIKDIILGNLIDFSGNNQQIKSIIENLFRSIIMKNPNVIKFHDRTIFEINPNNIANIENNQYLYSGYLTSANITESGLYMLINNINKLITGKTALTKMIEIQKKMREENYTDKEIYEEIKTYFKYHRTVLTTYGSLRTYKISDVDFDKNPTNTNILYKDKDEQQKSISLYNYYKIQYHRDIKAKNQPLIIAENNFPKNQKLLGSNAKNQTQMNYNIYLIPELVYITGIEEKNGNIKQKNMLPSRIRNPEDKMKKINGIFSLMDSNSKKKIRKKTGEIIELKSSKELCEEWGINLGNNLTFQGRILYQPKLYFDGKSVIPDNGRFKSSIPYKRISISNTNVFFIFDKNEYKYNHRKFFIDIMLIFKEKRFNFSSDFHPNKVKGFEIENSYNWENIKRSLTKIEKGDKIFGIIFCSNKLEKFYKELKDYFLKQLNIPTQHAVTKKLEGKNGKSIMYNLVDQINIKLGGENYYIDFKEGDIIKKGQVFLIIGLDSKRANGYITFSMSSSYNFQLYKFITQECTCEDKNMPRNLTLINMFKAAIEQIMKHCPHCPDYIIIYRQGGNEVTNKKLTISELNNFIDALKELKEENKNKDFNHNYQNTKIYYICCNLKSDLKFFETKRDNGLTNYKNPESGLVIDDKVIQSNKFEFYLQPQYVNIGTATPVHYQVMYFDKSENEEDDLKIERLEKLSFYLSFYYWTWNGAIRIPSLLKMSTTAMTFYRKIYDDNSFIFEQPTFI